MQNLQSLHYQKLEIFKLTRLISSKNPVDFTQLALCKAKKSKFGIGVIRKFKCYFSVESPKTLTFLYNLLKAGY